MRKATHRLKANLVGSLADPPYDWLSPLGVAGGTPAQHPLGRVLPDIAVERVIHLPIAVSEPGRPPLVLVRKAEPPGDVLPEIQNPLGLLFVRRVQLLNLCGRGARLASFCPDRRGIEDDSGWCRRAVRA